MKWPDFFLSLSPSCLSQIETNSRLLSKKRGDWVYRAGDTPQGLYIVQSGLVGLTLIGSQSGKEYLLRFFSPGHFFGHRSFFAGEPYHANTQVLEKSELAFIEGRAMRQALENSPESYPVFLKKMALELRRSEEQHVMILENEVLSRVAMSLVFLKETQPEYDWTRQEIANFCGSTVATVIRSMAELAEQGLIEQSGRSFRILDREALIAFQDTISS